MAIASTGAVSSLAHTSKVLVFALGPEEYGVEILRVREIIGMLDITPLPQMPAYVKGVINLRGRIIPVIELRGKLGLDPAAYTEKTCIVILEVQDTSTGEMYPMGAIVDSVREVLDLATDQVQPPPKFGGSVNIESITGLAKVRDRVIALLDVVRTFAGDEQASAVLRGRLAESGQAA